MKKIFIYYSHSGNGDLVAEFYKKKGYDVEKIIPSNPLPKNKFLSILIGGYKASVGYNDKLKQLSIDPNNYDEIIIGSPIWNSRLSSPINSLLNKIQLATKKTTFILYSASGKPNKATELLKKQYPKSRIINLTEPKKYPQEFEDILKKKG